MHTLKNLQKLIVHMAQGMLGYEFIHQLATGTRPGENMPTMLVTVLAGHVTPSTIDATATS